jgi:hypothetical protein
MQSLDHLINEYWETLVDAISKDAIRQIPSYGRAPLRQTVERVERWLKVLADSLAQNAPNILADYLTVVGQERQEEGYTIGELHAIVTITERDLRDLIDDSYADEVERNGQNALVRAVMDSARMILSVAYVLGMSARSLDNRG